MDIKLYSTTYCSYCRAAKQLLAQKNLAFTEIDCTDDQATRLRLVEETGRKTVPQLYIDGVPIGGFDDLNKLARSGELDKIAAGEAKPASVAR